MNNRFFTNLGLGISAAILAAAGCSTAATPTNLGSAQVRIDVSQAARDGNFVDRVVVQAANGEEFELTPHAPAFNQFAGSIILPAGANEIIGRAFSGDTLIGESAPVAVDVKPGLVVGATIRILDLTRGNVGHSPIAAVVTFPVSTTVDQAVAMAVSAIDPDGDDITFQWTSDCSDARFSNPTGTETEFIKETQGTCTVFITMSDGELATTESFKVVIFDRGAGTGGVEVDGVFITRPNISLNLSFPRTPFCSIFSGNADGTCRGPVALPDVAFANVAVDWGNAEPGTVELSDDCGGQLHSPFNDPFTFSGRWEPPVDGGLCLITARAVSPDGVTGELTAAVLVRSGQRPAAPQISATLEHNGVRCELLPGQGEVECPAFSVADDVTGSFELRFDFGGEHLSASSGFSLCNDINAIAVFQPLDFQFHDVFGEWFSLQPGECEIHLDATNVVGDTTEAVIRLAVE